MKKSSLKTGRHHTIFSIVEVKKIKNITKIEQKRLFFVYILGFIFMVFFTQRLIYTINI